MDFAPWGDDATMAAAKGTRGGAVMVNMPLFLIIVVIVVILLIATTSKNGRSARSQSRMCQSCGCSHPPFAQFCPRCGKQV
jgi:uncharacterized membrane protein